MATSCCHRPGFGYPCPRRPVSVTADRRLKSHRACGGSALRAGPPLHARASARRLVIDIRRFDIRHSQIRHSTCWSASLALAARRPQPRGPAGRQKGPPLIVWWLECRRLVDRWLFLRVVSLTRFLGPFFRCHPWHPAASMRCRPWHRSGSFSSATFCRYILSRNAPVEIPPAGRAFTCRQSPFAGGSSWQRLIALPIAHACPKHRVRFRRDGYARTAINVVCRGGVIRLGLFSGRTGALSDRLLMIPNDRQLYSPHGWLSGLSTIVPWATLGVEIVVG